MARREEPLEQLAQDLTGAGVPAYIITADLTDTDSIPTLAGQIRARVGNLDAFYYAPTPDGGFVPAANLTPQLALSFYTLLALV